MFAAVACLLPTDGLPSLCQGSSDVSRLTDLGREQAKAAGLGVHELITSSRDWPNLPLAAVFISPVSRAMETLDSIKQVWETPAVGRNDIKGARFGRKKKR